VRLIWITVYPGMQWICKQIRDSGSNASLFITESMDKKRNEEIIKMFQESCKKEYVPFTDQYSDIAGLMIINQSLRKSTTLEKSRRI
jgi:hypothetical protein